MFASPPPFADFQMGMKKRSVGKLQPVNVDGETRVILNGLGYNHQPLELSRKCLLTLNWPTMT